jgi:hypothetical protein
MPDVIWRGIPKRWRLGLELLVFFVAGCALLAQIGCESAAFVTSGNLHLRDVEVRPEFVMANDSPPATLRYWVGLNQPIHVRWGQIILTSESGECNVCPGQPCAGNMSTFTADPTIVVSYRNQAGAEVEEHTFAYGASCGASAWNAVFTPQAPELDSSEERQYLASIRFPNASPIPGDSVASGDVRIIPKSTTMPPRRLHAKDATTFQWPAPFDERQPQLYETFERKLQVGKVTVVQGRCSAPMPPMPPPDLERERLFFECGDDKSDIDEAAPVIPYRVIVTDITNADDYQRCESRSGEPDGGISLGRDPNNAHISLCFENASPRIFRPLTPTFLYDVGAPDRRRLVWKVEFDEEKGFPPPPMGAELWIIFTLEPLR